MVHFGRLVFIVCLILSAQFVHAKQEKEQESPSPMPCWTTMAVGAVVGTAAVAVGGPLALGALGFGSGGIAAGSAAAKMMGVAWSTGYGTGVVAGAQSVGAAGVGVAGKVVAGMVGSTIGGYFCDGPCFSGSSEKEKK